QVDDLLAELKMKEPGRDAAPLTHGELLPFRPLGMNCSTEAMMSRRPSSRTEPSAAAVPRRASSSAAGLKRLVTAFAASLAASRPDFALAPPAPIASNDDDISVAARCTLSEACLMLEAKA